MSESDNFATRLFRGLRRALAKDEETLQEYLDEGEPPSAVFTPYKLPCLRCGERFMYHSLGTEGRRNLCCSDECDDNYGKPKEEEDWEECTLEGFD